MNKKFTIVLSLLLTLSSCSPSVVELESSINYFNNHGLLNLLGWVFFPRLMFWFFSAITGGFWFWIGVLIAPRIMVAFWATTYYWNSNPVICIIAWIIALSGESSEKAAVKSRI